MTNDDVRRNLVGLDDDTLMSLALDEARAAMSVGEIPVGCVVIGDGEVIARGQTQVKRRESPIGHGELSVLLDLKNEIYRYSDLAIVTNLEPCIMCFGAMMQAGVSRVVFGMRAGPDGVSPSLAGIDAPGQTAPTVVADIRSEETVVLMGEFLKNYPDSPAVPYVQALLEHYGMTSGSDPR